MKVKRMLSLDTTTLNKLNDFCKDNQFYRNSYIAELIETNIDYLNDIETISVKKRNKGVNKGRVQIYIEEDVYNAIQGKKSTKIQLLLEEHFQEEAI